jgi:ABC-type transport system substrate-binding protein
MRCSKCNNEEFVKYGTAPYPPGSKISYGLKQKMRCKGCGKITTMKGWVWFDKVAYRKYQNDKFQTYIQYKHDYDKAKKELGWGGYRIEDL